MEMSSLTTTISRVIWQIEGSGASDNECGTVGFKGTRCRGRSVYTGRGGGRCELDCPRRRWTGPILLTLVATRDRYYVIAPTVVQRSRLKGLGDVLCGIRDKRSTQGLFPLHHG